MTAAGFPDAEPAESLDERYAALADLRAAMLEHDRVVLTTHVNADGDGAGSEVALAIHLRENGVRPTIVNPTRFPESLRFMLGDLEAHRASAAAGREALEKAGALVMLDTAEPQRIGAVAPYAERLPTLVIDHHPPAGPPIGDLAIRDPSACATGELIYDLITQSGKPPTPMQAQALYVAIATDTGGFRFSNTTPRAHAIAAEMIGCGVRPEEMYRHLYGQHTQERLALIRLALDNLKTDDEVPAAWISLRQADVMQTGATTEDQEGLVEYPRRLKGVEIALLIRELGPDRTKVSLRSNGAANVARIAADLGGGGHEKAAGVLLREPFERAEIMVLSAVRDALALADFA